MTDTHTENNEKSFLISFFNNKKDNKPKEKLLTWQKFVAHLEKPVVRREKDGELFAPCLFEPKKRAKSNVKYLSMLVFDIDHNANVENIKTGFEKLQSAFLINTTHSHLRITDSNPKAEPRFRVCVPLAANVPAERFPELWQIMKKVTGQPFDEAAKDESRMYYLPAIAEQSAPYEFYENAGDFLDWQVFLNKMQAEIVQDGHKPTKKQSKKAASLKPFNDIQIELNENADIGQDVLNRLKKLPKFLLTWERRRTDLLDNTGNGYDMSLTNLAIIANLDNQTICNLLVTHRRNHQDEKLRLDYYQRTIAEGRNAMQVQLEKDAAQKIPADHHNKDVIRDAIQTILGIRIERIEKMATEPPEFTIFFSGNAKINIGNSKGLYKQDDFRRFVGDAINKAPAKIKGDAWESIVQKLFALVEVVQPGEDLSEEGLFKEQIQSFLAKSEIYRNEDEYTQKLTDAFSENFNMAGMVGDSLCIQAESLWQHIKMKYDRQTERKRIIINLKKIGAYRLTKKVRLGKKTTSYSLYALPDDFTKSVIEQAAIETDEPDYAGKQNRLSTESDEWQM